MTDAPRAVASVSPRERTPLAFTAALEHYTATLAETLLSDEDARAEIGDDGVRSLLLWHALEESEHKAVAFDVYRAVGGTERMRIAVIWLTHLLFVLETTAWTVISLTMDPALRRHPLRVLRSAARVPRSPAAFCWFVKIRNPQSETRNYPRYPLR